MSDRTDSGTAAPDSADTASLPHLFDWIRWPEVWLFAAFNAADIVLTYVLIGHFGHQEGNPIAAYVVYGWGLRGMIWMKLGVVALLCFAVHFVSQKKPLLARRVIRFGAVAVGAVVAYSLLLLSRVASA
jgi:hypothetical protein